MRASLRTLRPALGALLATIVAVTNGLGAATISQRLSPGQVAAGQPAELTLTVTDSNITSLVVLSSQSISLPEVDGLQTLLTGTKVVISNGGANTTFRYAVTASQPGGFTIPAFDVRAPSGEILHVKAMTLQVTAARTAAVLTLAAQTAAPAAAQPMQVADTTVITVTNPPGPVVMPQTNSAPDATAPASIAPPADASATDSTAPPEVTAPRDPDGGPAKVFIIITPQTTDAYVGEAVPMEIDFYIRMDVNSDQNSLPTIKGSDFLMNSFTHRGAVTIGLVEQEQYMRETWVTSIAAPKSGDFPLSMQRDTYWVKPTAPQGDSILDNFFTRRSNLAHQMIDSNLLIMHIHALPESGRPDHFTGAIGQLRITGEAEPSSVAVGEPVHLRFTVSGEGNFDYIRSPALEDDPAWKAYVPTSKTNYVDESHVEAMKIFDQSIIPQKGGVLPLPSASFSYFDPGTKQYVTVPVKLPAIVVTGSASPVAAVPAAEGDNSAASPAPTPVADLLPNRPEMGAAHSDLTPSYRRAWFWGVQAGLVALPLAGALLAFLRFRSNRDADARALRVTRQRSLQQEFDAMSDAVKRQDARAFFIAARHAVQLRLGAQWDVAPEALTFREIRARDAQLAETLEPLFHQADEAIYSGNELNGADLATWEQRVRTDLLQLQPVSP